MRFIIGFIFFGLFFYGMSLFFPDAFAVLVSWAKAFWDFVIGLYEQATGHVATRPNTP